MKITANSLIIAGGVVLLLPFILGLIGGGLALLFDCTGNGYTIELSCNVGLIETLAGFLSGIGFVASFVVGIVGFPLLIIGVIMKGYQKDNSNAAKVPTKSDRVVKMILLIAAALLVLPILLMFLVLVVSYVA